MGCRYLIVIILLCTIALHAQNIQDVDDVINAAINCHNNPGLTVSVVKNGQVVLSKGYGIKDLQTLEPVTNQTLFGIASLTKAFTSTLLAKLLRECTVYRVKTNVYKVLDNKKLFNNSLRSTYATLEDLLSHRMGIPRHNFLRLSSTLTRENLISRMRYLKSKGAFRKSFYYSDLMYGMLTSIIEHIGAGQWEDLMTQHILSPLQMTGTKFGTRHQFSSSNTATPYVTENGVLTKPDPDFIRHWALIGGSGSMLSSAEDMAQWLLFQLNGGKKPDGTSLMNTGDFEATHKPLNMISSANSTTGKYFTRPKVPVTTSNDGYALGWKTGFYRGLRMIQHTGTTWGYAALMTLLPDEEIGIFTSMSGGDPKHISRIALHNYIADVFLGETPWLNTSTICNFQSPLHPASRKKRVVIITDHSIYTGIYRNEAYGNIEITYSSEILTAHFGFGQWTLLPSSNTIFKAVWSKEPPNLDFKFTFKKTSGVVTKLTPNFEEADPPIFFKISETPTIIG